MNKICLVLIFALIANFNLKSQTWQQSSGIPSNDLIYDLVSCNNYVFAATLSGIYRSDDNGKTFEPKNNGIPNTSGLCARAFSVTENKIYVANTYGIFVTDDFGDNWVDLNLPDPSLSVFVDNNIILAGVPGGGLYRTTDNGANWVIVAVDHIYKIAKIDNYYFAGSWEDVVYSDDYGANWQSANYNKFTWLTFLMNDTIFACPTDGGIEKTSPDNINWQTVAGISAIVTGISIKNDTIFAVATDKVLYSKYSEMNNTWNEITTTGLPVLGTNELSSSTIQNNNLIVGTWGSDGETALGVWYIDMNKLFTSINDVENKNRIGIYPNPSNSLLFINGFVQNSIMSIYDLNGKMYMDKESVKNQVDIGKLKNGIYIITIETANGNVSRKFVKQ